MCANYYAPDLTAIDESVANIDSGLFGASGSILGLPNLNVGNAFQGCVTSILAAETIIFTATTPGYAFVQAFIDSANAGSIVNVYRESVAPANLISSTILNQTTPSAICMDYPAGSPVGVVITIQSDATNDCTVCYSWWTTEDGTENDYIVSEYNQMKEGSSATITYAAEQMRILYATFGQEERSVLRFDFSAVPAGALVTSAILHLTPERNFTASDFHMALTSEVWIADECSWDDRTTGVAWTIGGDGDGALLPVPFISQALSASVGVAEEFTVTSQVRAWVEGSAVNNGFIMYINPKNATNDCWWESGLNPTPALRPKLVITTL